MSTVGVSRRELLRRSLGAGGLISISALMAACASSPIASRPTAGTSAGRPLTLPAFLPPANLPTPDSAGSADGVVESGFVNWPNKTYQSVKQAPGDGSDVSVFLNLMGAPPPPVDQNPAWQAWNKALNVKLTFQFYAFADLAVKFGTLIAGNDLPDVISTLVRQDIPLTPELFAAKAADLTPYVSGDAIKDYPNLAALPTRSWKGMIFDNKIYGVPVPTPYGQFFWWPLIHQELLDALGTSQPRTPDEYKKVMLDLTRPQRNQYGSLTQAGYQYSYEMNTGNGWYPSMFGAPNLWSVDANGKFTHIWETDAYKRALAFDVDLYKAGVFHPDSVNLNVVTAATSFQARQGAFVFSGLRPDFWDIRGTAAEGLQPPANINLLTPPAVSGSKPQYFTGRPAFSIAFLKKAPEPRIKMLLRVLDYIAAPFGSDELLLITYGVKGRDWEPDANGNPIITRTGQSDMAGISTGSTSFLATLTGRYQVLYSAADPSFAKRIQGFQKILAPISVEDASLGLFSATQASKGVALIQPFGDGITDIVTGRRPLADLDDLVKAWKSAGGDASRTEYEKAYAAAH